LLNQKRKSFRQQQNISEILFTKIEVEGFNKKQQKFITKSIFYKQKPFTLYQLRKRYFKLSSEDKIKNIFPIAIKDSLKNEYTLKLTGKKEKPFYLQPGAILSNRPISEAFIGAQYNYFGRVAFLAYANAYIGKLHSSTFIKTRFDFSGRVPFFIEPSFTFSKWDYYSSSALFYDFLKPAYLLQEDKFGELKMGVPIGNFSQFNFSGGVTEWKNQYYQSDNFTKQDTADATNFNYNFVQANYKINTLNRKMYASEGAYLNIRGRYLQGLESYIPGSTGNPSMVAIKSYIRKLFQHF
jgi:NTE family protein